MYNLKKNQKLFNLLFTCNWSCYSTSSLWISIYCEGVDSTWNASVRVNINKCGNGLYIYSEHICLKT